MLDAITAALPPVMPEKRRRAFVYDHENPPPPHSQDIAEERARRAKVLLTVKGAHRIGVDDRLVALAVEAVRNADECEYLAYEDFAKGNAKLEKRIRVLVRRTFEVRDLVAEIPAQSFAGLMAKGLVASDVVDLDLDGEPCKSDPANFMLATLIADINRMGGASLEVVQ